MLMQLQRFGFALLSLLTPAVALAAGGEAGHDAGHDAGHGPARGLVEFDAATAVWVVIIFLILLAILYPTAWKNVLAGLKAREERIRRDIAEAEAARAKAEATLREYNGKLAEVETRVRDMISSATVEGERLATQIRMRAQQEAEESKERATREIDAAKKQALTEIYEQTADLATRVAEKIVRKNLNADDQRELVRSSLEQLQGVGGRS